MTRVLGLDTSCYTTSAAIASDGGIFQNRRLLTVPDGARGLRQSEALFQHVERLPSIIEALICEAGSGFDAVCAASRPRDVAGSYMPVFLSGLGAGREIAAAMGVPFIETSHQQGHVRAAMVDSGIGEYPFIALHLSGGTTEALLVEAGLKITLVAGSTDLHAGQFLDRIGVKMGLGFPAGAELGKLARGVSAKSEMPLSANESGVSFSGAEAQAVRMIEAGRDRSEVAAEVFSYLIRATAKLIELATEKCRVDRALISGGVAASDILREGLEARLKKRGAKALVRWGRSEYSGDNAVGVALIGYDKLKEARSK